MEPNRRGETRDDDSERDPISRPQKIEGIFQEFPSPRKKRRKNKQTKKGGPHVRGDAAYPNGRGKGKAPAPGRNGVPGRSARGRQAGDRIEREKAEEIKAPVTLPPLGDRAGGGRPAASAGGGGGPGLRRRRKGGRVRGERGGGAAENVTGTRKEERGREGGEIRGEAGNGVSFSLALRSFEGGRGDNGFCVVGSDLARARRGLAGRRCRSRGTWLPVNANGPD